MPPKKPEGEKYKQLTFSLPGELKASVIEKAKNENVNLSAIITGLLKSWLDGTVPGEVPPTPTPTNLTETAIESIVNKKIAELMERGLIPTREEEPVTVTEHKPLDTYQSVSICIDDAPVKEILPERIPEAIPEPVTIPNQDEDIEYPDVVTKEMSIAMGNAFQKFKDKTGIKNREKLFAIFGVNTSNEAAWRDGKKVMTRDTYGKMRHQLRKSGFNI